MLVPASWLDARHSRLSSSRPAQLSAKWRRRRGSRARNKPVCSRATARRHLVVKNCAQASLGQPERRLARLSARSLARWRPFVLIAVARGPARSSSRARRPARRRGTDIQKHSAAPPQAASQRASERKGARALPVKWPLISWTKVGWLGRVFASEAV